MALQLDGGLWLVMGTHPMGAVRGSSVAPRRGAGWGRTRWGYVRWGAGASPRTARAWLALQMWKNTAISQGQKQGGHGGMALHAAPIRAARLKMAPTHHIEGIQTSWARLRRLISPAGRPKMRPKNGTRVETLD